MEHGPGLHGPVLLVLLALAVVGGLLYLLKSRRRSHRTPDASHRSPEASDRLGPDANDRDSAA
jgi:hypothetical protein